MDDNVEAAPIYRCDGKAGLPTVRTHKNHDPAHGTGTYMDGESTEATNTVNSSSCIQIIGHNYKNQGIDNAHMVCCQT